MTLGEFLAGHRVPDWREAPDLYLALVPIVRAWAMERGLQFADADDLAVRVLAPERLAPGALPPHTDCERVLRRRVRNAVVDFFRARGAERRRVAAAAGELARAARPGLDGELTSADQQRLVQQALALLSDGQRALIACVQTHRNGPDVHAKVAAELGYASAASAREMVHRAMNALRAHVARLRKEAS
jgi:DNA-directed RNA polymerase specialized sigma24 family protein